MRARQSEERSLSAKQAAPVSRGLPLEAEQGDGASAAPARPSRRSHSNALLLGVVLLGVVPLAALVLLRQPFGKGLWSPIGWAAARANEQARAALTPRPRTAESSSTRVAPSPRAVAPSPRAVAPSPRAVAPDGLRLGVPGGVHIAPGVQVVGAPPRPEQAAYAPSVEPRALRARTMIIANVAASSASGARPGRGTPPPAPSKPSAGVRD